MAERRARALGRRGAHRRGTTSVVVALGAWKGKACGGWRGGSSLFADLYSRSQKGVSSRSAAEPRPTERLTGGDQRFAYNRRRGRTRRTEWDVPGDGLDRTLDLRDAHLAVGCARCTAAHSGGRALGQKLARKRPLAQVHHV